MGVIRGSSYYTIVDGPHWADAEANAVELGGHLASINNESENSFVLSSFAGNPRFTQSDFGIRNVYNSYVGWIGLYYDFNISAFRNSDGSNQSYFNWASSADGRNRPLSPRILNTHLDQWCQLVLFN